METEDENNFFDKINRLLEEEDYQGVLGSCNQAIEKFPNQSAFYATKGQCLYQLKRNKEALKAVEEAIGLNNKAVLSWQLKAWILNDSNRNKEALEAAEEGIKLGNVDSWRLKGGILNKLGRYDDALKSAEKVTELLEEDDVFNLRLKAGVLYNLKKYNEAFVSVEEAIKRNKKDITSWLLKAEILIIGFNKHCAALKLMQDIPEESEAKKFRSQLIWSDYFWENAPYSESGFLEELCKIDDDFSALSEEMKVDEKFLLPQIRRLWGLQYKILNLLRVKFSEKFSAVSHYTSIQTFEKVIGENKEARSFLKLCSLSCANDSQEGNIFSALLGESNILSYQKNDLLVLQLSFSVEEDSLNQFRLYGKKEGEEGTGVCLSFSKELFLPEGEGASLINKAGINAPFDMQLNEEGGIVKIDRPTSSECSKDKSESRLPLYWVLYYSREKKRIYYTPAQKECFCDETGKYFEPEGAREQLEKIAQLLMEMKECYKNINDDVGQKIALRFLIYVRHLIKDAAFRDEKELRILSLYNNSDEKLQVLPGKDCLCVDYRDIFAGKYSLLKKVIVGPKVKGFSNFKELWRHHINKVGSNADEIDFIQSNAPLV